MTIVDGLIYILLDEPRHRPCKQWVEIELALQLRSWVPDFFHRLEYSNIILSAAPRLTDAPTTFSRNRTDADLIPPETFLPSWSISQWVSSISVLTFAWVRPALTQSAHSVTKVFILLLERWFMHQVRTSIPLYITSSKLMVSIDSVSFLFKMFLLLHTLSQLT